MNRFFSKDQVYQLDRRAIELDRLSARELMGRAAASVWSGVQDRWPNIERIAVFAGAGNNGGDAFALANLACDQGFETSLFMVGEFERQSDASSGYRDQWLARGGVIQRWQGICPETDLIVDGLLGIGLDRELDPALVELIEALNSQPVPRVSIDIPSGLHADRGIPQPVAIRANLTVSFIGRKQGCYLADGPDYCGERVFDPLGLSQAVLSSLPPSCAALDPQTIQLPYPRTLNSYKNRYGHVLVVGGERGMSGAVRLAALAALRCGAGLVSACVHPDNYALVAGAHAEIMVDDWNNLQGLLQRASVVVVGPGLGQSARARQVLEALAGLNLPMVIDADALTDDFLDALGNDRSVITPHPGEAGRLIGWSSTDVQRDRCSVLEQLIERWALTCVLKGAGSLVGRSGDMPLLSLQGNPGMATAGAGDVLSGIIGGLLAQGLQPTQAAACGVYLHARAGDLYCIEYAQESLIAGDLIDYLGLAWNELRGAQVGDAG